MAFSHPSYPVMLLLSGRPCLVVGGNAEALRKCQGLLKSGAMVTLVAEEVLAELRTLAIQIEQRPYRSGEAADYYLAFATTGTALDHQVFLDAEAAKVFCNATDDVANCSFVAPAIGRRAEVSIAVGTDGRSPAFATYLRDEILATLPEPFEAILETLARTHAAIIDASRPTAGLGWRELIESLVERTSNDPASLEQLGQDFLDRALDSANE